MKLFLQKCKSFTLFYRLILEKFETLFSKKGTFLQKIVNSFTIIEPKNKLIIAFTSVMSLFGCSKKPLPFGKG